MSATYSRQQTLSATALLGFARCPHQFLLGTVRNVQPRYETPEQRRGTTIHGMIVEAIGGAGDDAVPSWNRAKEMAVYSSPPEDRSDLSELIKAIEDRRGNPPVFCPPGAHAVMVERSWGLDINGRPVTPLLPIDGQPANSAVAPPAFGLTTDLVCLLDDGQTAWITDWKTNRRPEYKEQLDLDLQMMVYGYGVLSHYPEVTRVVLEKDYVRFGWEPVKAELPREAFAGVWNEIAARSAGVFACFSALDQGASDVEAFPFKPSNLCAWCGVRSHCPAWSQALVLPDPALMTTTQQAVSMALKVQQAEALVKIVKEQLRVFVEENGPIIHGGQRLDFWPQNENRIDNAGVWRVLSDAGYTDDQIKGMFSISKTALDELSKGKERKALKLALDGAITKVAGTPKFMWRKERMS